ncbi:c-type cytochrome [Hymenobacter sp. RP-2-7]|uniref:Type IV secretion system putative lipoprotein virB7 n=1 Tax=Hymenobacter polaris TaxID=2682546 RepID=A0A7Y0ADU0_9BACT|nr:c-type cytochrome [Hymenobacter polaris]NML65357.1 c-type cytochrome [Hymenobacter polaris]
MKKVFLFLSATALLAACNSGYQPDGGDRTSVERQTPADTAPTGLNPDSTAERKLAAVTNQVQVDTSMTHLGTTDKGTPDSPGAKLMAASDCASCHRENEKLIGPGYKQIAAKYPATPENIAMLSQHIIKGGAGHWGDIPMTPHPNLSETDTKEMVKYILSLK